MNKDTTVILWLYHTDLAQEFYDLLKPLNDLLDIRLCLCKDNDNTEVLNLFSDLDNITSIKYYPNVGVDVYSFLQEIAFIDTPYFLKLHSKTSIWGTNGQCNWRKILLDTFIGDRNTFIRNVEMLKSGAGYLSCRPLTYVNDEGSNGDKIQQLLKLICCPTIKNKSKKFCGGNMFAGNTSLYQKLLLHNQDAILDLVKQEKNKVDESVSGTYCHSLERIFGYIGGLYNYKFSYRYLCDLVFLILFFLNQFYRETYISYF